MNIKKSTIPAKIGLILLLILSIIFTYNSISGNWKLLGIPYSILSVLDLIGSIFLVVFIYNFSFKTHYVLKFKAVINLGLIGCGLLSITPIISIINRISLQSQYSSRGMNVNFGFVEILFFIIPIAVNILLLLSIFKLKTFGKINALKYSFILGLASSISGIVISLHHLIPNYNRWSEFKNTFYSGGIRDSEYQQIFVNILDLFNMPRFFVSVITATSYILLALFFTFLLRHKDNVKVFLESKKYDPNHYKKNSIKEQNNVQEHNTNKKIKNILIGTILVAAFFMPWVKVLGFGGSAYDLIVEVFKNLEYLKTEPLTFLIFLLLLFPLCGLIIVFNYFKNDLKPFQVRLIQFAKKTPLILILTTIIIAIIKSRKGLEYIKFDDLGEIIKIFSVGIFLTLISSILLFFDKTKKPKYLPNN